MSASLGSLLCRNREMKSKEILIGCILTVVFFKCLSTSNTTMSMTWQTVYMYKLILTCNVRNMQYTVWITNGRTNSSAFCYLNGECYNGGYSTVDNSSNVTTMRLTVSNISEINNDKWTCKHGKNRDQTSVDVIVNRDKQPTQYDIPTQYCIQLMSFAAMIGFVITFLLVFIGLALHAVIQESQLKPFPSTIIKIRFAIICGSLLILLILPIVTGGFINNCNYYGLMAIFGVLLAVLFSMSLFCHKVPFERDKSNDMDRRRREEQILQCNERDRDQD